MKLDIINLTFAGVHPVFLPKKFSAEYKRSRLIKDIDSNLILFTRKHFINIFLKIKLSV